MTTAQSNHLSSPISIWPLCNPQKSPCIISALLSQQAISGPSALSGTEFRICVALQEIKRAGPLGNNILERINELIGLAPETVSRLMRGLVDKGWLRLEFTDDSNRRGVHDFELLTPPLTQGVAKQRIVSRRGGQIANMIQLELWET